MVNDSKQMNSILYMLPCKKKGDVCNFKIDNYEFKEILDEDKYLRNLIRGDVIDFINNKMKIYRIDFSKSENIETKVYFSNKVNIDFNLLRLYLIEFDADNMFFVLNCSMPSDDTHVVNTKEILNNHRKFMANYFYFNQDSGESYLHLKMYDKNYPLFSNDNKSISELLNIEFDFNNFNTRFVMISTFIDKSINMNDKNNEIYKFIDDCIYINRGYFLEKEYKSYRTENFISKSSNYGSVIAYKANYDIESEDFINVNKRNMRAFYHELFYEYIIALNYKIRLEKFLIKIGKLKYDTKKPKEYINMKNDLLEYKRFSSESYFVNVSGFDTSNSWYHNIWDGLDIDLLDEEVDTKFKYSMEYIKIKLDELEIKHNRFINFITSYAAFIGSLALFVLAVIQSVSCLTDTEGTKLAALISIGVAGGVFVIKVIFDIIKFVNKNRTGH